MRAIFAVAIVLVIVACTSAGPFESEHVFEAIVRGGDQKSVNLRDIDTDSGLSVDNKLTMTRRRRSIYGYRCQDVSCDQRCRIYGRRSGRCERNVCNCVGIRMY